MHRLGQQLGVVALLAGTAYLVWRTGWSWHGHDNSVAWFLAIPAVAVEVSGFVCVAALMWALWHRPSSITPTARGAERADVDYDIAIVATSKTVGDVRATLVALQLDPARPSALVIDHNGRADIVAVAAEFGAAYRVPDVADTSALGAIAHASEREYFMLLNAGDVPAIGAARSLFGWMSDPSIAVVQGVVSPTPGDSAEHGPNGRHDLTFERSGLNPGLGTRGTGILTGSGALVRRSALRDLELPTGSRHSVMWELMPTLAANDMYVVGAAGPAVVAEKPSNSPEEVTAVRRAQADAGWRLLVGASGVFRASGLRVRDRLALTAWAVRSLDGLRRVVLGAIVFAALLAGRSPFTPVPIAMWYLWAPSFVLASLSLALLSGGSLRPGDRLRGSVRDVTLSVGTVIAINSVLVIRGISDRFTHALRPLDHTAQIGLTIVSLWLLTGSLDSLRLLARRRHNRRAVRLAASGTGRLDELGVYVSDITMLGAGLLSDCPLVVGASHRLTFSVPSASGVTSLDMQCVVRNSRADLAGSFRVGVEFHDVDSYALNTLAESCAVMPARALLEGASVSTPVVDESAVSGGGPRRFALQVATLFALAGVVSSVAPLSAEAGPPSTRLVSGIIVDIGDPPSAPQNTSTGNTSTVNTNIVDTTTNPVTTDSPPLETATPTDSIVTDPTSPEVPPASVDVGGSQPTLGMGGITVIAVCSIDAGPDGTYGTNDDTYGPSVSTLTNDDGHYELVLSGEACWMSIEPPVEQVWASSTVAGSAVGKAVLVNLGSSGSVKLAPVEIDRVSTNPTPSIAALGTGALGDHVWADLNADGVQQSTERGVSGATVTLYNGSGATVGSMNTSDDGRFMFEHLRAGAYSLGVSNLPLGLRTPTIDPLMSRLATVTLRTGQRLSSLDVGLVDARSATRPRSSLESALPTPTLDQLNSSSGTAGSVVAAVVIMLVAALLAASVLFSSAQPIRVRRLTSR